MGKGRQLAFWSFGVAIAAFFLFKPLATGSAFLGRLLTEPVYLYFGSLSKLFFLGLGAYYARRCATLFPEDSPIHRAWTVLAGGLLFYFLGQASLGYYQMVLFVPTPFPSPADAFFVVAMLLLTAALIQFIVAYRDVGYPTGSTGSLVAIGTGVGVVLLTVSIPLLRPILAEPAPFLTKALNLAYPLLDVLVLAPAAVLASIALRFRGGGILRVWGAILVGFGLVGLGDLLFAYLITFEVSALDPVLDVAYIWAYMLIALGCRRQLDLAGGI